MGTGTQGDERETRPMRVKTLLGRKVVAIAVLAVVGLGLTGCLPDTSATPPGDPYTDALLNAMNRDRASVGLPPLTWSPKLANNAGGWANIMANDNSLHHQDLGGLLNQPLYAPYHTLGENILDGPGSMTPDSVEAAWRASGPHWANISSQAFNVVGIGYFRGPDGRIWAVQEFGGL
jgi:uncharacterized protein YkwD